MKKAERVLYTVFKVLYVVSTVAVVATFIHELFDPTVAQPTITSNDWFTLSFMSCVFVLITEREKNARLLTADNN